MLAPPDTTFGSATGVRSVSDPWGSVLLDHDHNLLHEHASPERVVGYDHDQLSLLRKSLESVNILVDNIISLIRHLDVLCIPWMLEHPRSSILWELPFFQDCRNSAKGGCVSFDMCQFGSSFKKRTQILYSNIDQLDMQRLNRLCSNSGDCIRTGKCHTQINGSHAARSARKFPKQLCTQIAKVFHNTQVAQQYNIQ